MTLRQFAPFALIAIALWGCTFRPNASFRVQVDPGALPRMAPNGRVAYAAYLVNIYGSGISPTLGSASIGSYAPDCLGVGISSRLVSAEDLKAGVRLKIPSGSGRSIQILGVVTYLTTDVIGEDVTVLFEKGRIPELYELAVAEDQSIFSDKTITLDTPSAQTTPVNVLTKCFAETTGEFDPASVAGVALFTATHNYSVPSANRIQTLSFNKDDGKFTLDSTNFFTPNTFESYLATTPDGKRVVAWEKTGGYNEYFDVVNPGILERKGTSDLSGFYDVREISFSGTGRYAIARANVRLTFFEYLPTGEFSYTGNFSYITHQFFLLGSRFYDLINSAGRIYYANTGLLSGEGKVGGDTATVLTQGSFSGDDARGNSVLTKKGIYFLFQDGTSFRVAFFRFEGSDLVAAGNVYEADMSTGALIDSAIAISPDDRYAYIKAPGSANPIVTYKLKSSGGLDERVAPDLPVSGLTALLVDPTSQYVIVGTSSGGLSALRSYVMNSNGTLGVPLGQPADTLTAGLADYLENVVAVPLK